MDPITQAVLGASFTRIVRPQVSAGLALSLGGLGGMAADLDVLIRSQSDSLLAIEYHRHFTHSLAFVPVGGLVVSVFLWPFFRKRIGRRELYTLVTLGFATHGLLDACTSYGTMLFWPFSDERVSWSNIAIVDPVYTGILIMGCLVSLKSKSTKTIKVLFGLSCAYLLLGYAQRISAETIAAAELRRLGQQESFDISAKPTVLNLWLWRVNYSQTGLHCVMAVYNPFWDRAKIYPGSCTKSINLDEAKTIAGEDTRLFRDIRRFHWFSQGVLGEVEGRKNFLSDIRYSVLPNSLEPMWGIEIDPSNPDKGAQYQITRETNREKFKIFTGMLRGVDLERRPGDH